MQTELNRKRYAAVARQAAAEGIVLLENNNQTLPFDKKETVSVFGRTQFDYYKSGTGSGGMVHAPYVVGIYDALSRSERISVNEELAEVYRVWRRKNPVRNGIGWASEPYFQKEMPVSAELVRRAAEKSDAAVVVIGRSSGEDRDNIVMPGSYLLTATEEELLYTVCRQFSRVAVVLNTGGIMDMKWVKKYRPGAVLYVWQGGQEGGNAVCDVLTGAVNPCGRLTDTIAEDIEDYPSTAYFGGRKRNFYTEDIYVGYRYFETAAKDRVLYPFGFGLSYTAFEPTVHDFTVEGFQDASTAVIRFACTVKNTGKMPGKQVMQVYASAPQAKLGKPARELKAFAKTRLLPPGKTETLRFDIPLRSLASYDDSGTTGFPCCYVLEKGAYTIFCGENVRTGHIAGIFELPETTVTEGLSEALRPVRPFERIRFAFTGGKAVMQTEAVPLRSKVPFTPDRSDDSCLSGCDATGDRGFRMPDVADGKVTLREFTAQLSDEALCCLVRGEGLHSKQVTPGTAGAFGGVTKELRDFGIPAACTADGPSGIRMDSGKTAFSLPCATALGCTFNSELVTELFGFVGQEMRENRVDLLLGPGMNIHRNPLGGRNFEYFSEDPCLTGRMAAAELRGLQQQGVSGVIKHFAANNQERCRTKVDSVVSERALREIYLKGFEIAVKEGKAVSVMSTYGAVNGLWTAGSYDLLTRILRGEWGFQGAVMTDWWARINDEGRRTSRFNLSSMIQARNDLYMVVKNGRLYPDNLKKGLRTGKITRKMLLRSAENILGLLLRLPVMQNRGSGHTADIMPE